MAYVSARLTELELKYMRLERTVEELSGVVAEQQKTIDSLLRELHTMSARLRDGDAGDSEASAPSPESDKPPHY